MPLLTSLCRHPPTDDLSSSHPSFRPFPAPLPLPRERLAEVAEQNAVTLRLRADERRRQVEDEIAYMREQEALMDRQQKAREERLAKAREWQARVEARARDLPAGREWLSAEVQERYLKEREEQDRAEDERRKQALVRGW